MGGDPITTYIHWEPILQVGESKSLREPMETISKLQPDGKKSLPKTKKTKDQVIQSDLFIP